MRIPMLFLRMQPCPPDSPVRPNSARINPDGHLTGYHPVRESYVVAYPTHTDYSSVSTAWQDNPLFPEGEMYLPGIDLLAQEDTYVFDGDSPKENLRQALAKMKELWMRVEIDA
jgi:hypothetical protein